MELEPFIDNNNNNNNNKQKPIQLWRYFNNKLSSKWTNVTVTLPTNFHQRYYLKFGAALGLKSTSTFFPCMSYEFRKWEVRVPNLNFKSCS